MNEMSTVFSALLVFVAQVGVASPVDFDRDIHPLLADHCYQCHGPDAKQRQAGLRLDLQEGLFRVEKDVSIVVPGKPDQSELIRRITHPDPAQRMPPAETRSTLSREQIDLVRRWIQGGASWKGHWSLQPIRQPAIPSTFRIDSGTSTSYGRADRARNPIDHFVLRQLSRQRFPASPPASPERILRRVTFDLTGVPPTLKELDEFLADDSPNAYQKVLDRLLGSPRYGERMVWDWLDAARYADTNGFQDDFVRTMWPWRDWAVKALNENMPFDQFTIWQLAGDLLPDATFEQKLATGFCRNHMINGEGGRIAEENRVEYIFDQIETLGTVWLGMTVQCCRCHDHKFDPLRQQEYYQLFAFFNQTPVDGRGRFGKTPPVVTLANDQERRRTGELKQLIDAAASAVADFEESFFDESSDASVEASRAKKDLPDPVRKALKTKPVERHSKHLSRIEEHFSKSAPEYKLLLQPLREAVVENEELQKDIPHVMVMQDMEQPRKTFVLNKGLYDQQGEEVSAATPAVFSRVADNTPTDRLSLSRWLLNPAHPLTARVTVNRHWQLFFGTGLVETVGDFGSQGKRPSHPDLLDWLAWNFSQSGWNTKMLHHKILTSATYRQTSKRSAPRRDFTRVRDQADDGAWQVRDRDLRNRWLARGPRFRMPAWMIRDQALAVSGQLSDRIGGPPVKPYQPAGVWSEVTFGTRVYERDHGEKLYRRSLYTFWRRIVGPTLFFDAGKRQTCTVNVTRTNTPLHALVTLNDVTYVEAARGLAQRVMESSGPLPDDRIELAFRLTTSRRTSQTEREILRSRYATLKDQYATESAEATKLLANGESPRNEQLDTTEHAALTSLCLMLLNLDESLSK